MEVFLALGCHLTFDISIVEAVSIINLVCMKSEAAMVLVLRSIIPGLLLWFCFALTGIAIAAPKEAQSKLFASRRLARDRYHRSNLPDPNIPAIGPISSHSSRNFLSIPSNALTERDLLSVLRVGLITNLYIFYRHFYMVSSPSTFRSIDPYTQPLRNMYTFIWQKAVHEWAKLPEQSIVRITYGRILFEVMPIPGEGKTVPWTYLEEVVHMLLIGLTAGLIMFFEGWVSLAPVTVAWLYVVVSMPPGSNGNGLANSSVGDSGRGRVGMTLPG